MILTLIFAFLAGIVTILSPCILPILPIILSSTVDSGKINRNKPIGVIVGFILSFTFFTLFLSSIIKIIGIPSDSLRNISILVIFIFGVSYLIPRFQVILEKLFTFMSNFVPNGSQRVGFSGGLFIGLSLGLLWTPCVGPILASVISLAISGVVTFSTFLVTLAYSIGTAIPMFLIMIGGQNLMQKFPKLRENTSKIQIFFGLVMILMAIALYFNLDRNFQSYILDKFPNYGTNLTKFEEKAKINNIESGFSNSYEIISDGEWFNSEPLQLSDLKGKVVLVDFWTYTCINCQRTLPYVENWYEKYKNEDFVVIGVHTPEFEFEKIPKNVQMAIKDFKLTYPVVQDNNFRTWNKFDNHYWPAKYIFNQDGRLVYTHFGEGEYDDTEKVIQDLLKVNFDISNPLYENHANTPETYLGTARKVFNINLKFIGNWSYSSEYAMPSKDAILLYKFDAQNVYLVMKPKEEGIKGDVKVYIDDIYQKTITVDRDNLYDLLKLETPGEHDLKLEFMDNNIEVFAFTFG